MDTVMVTDVVNANKAMTIFIILPLYTIAMDLKQSVIKVQT